MSIEVTLICDMCARVIGAGRTATEIRAEMKRDGHAKRIDGKDVCVFCETSPPKEMSPEQAAIYHGDIDGDFDYA